VGEYRWYVGDGREGVNSSRKIERKEAKVSGSA